MGSSPISLTVADAASIRALGLAFGRGQHPPPTAPNRCQRIVTEETKKEMRRILKEIQTGQFAREWILENKAGAPAFKAIRRRERQHPIEEVGKRLRKLMNWINAKEV